MKLEEVMKIKEMLSEAFFKEINPSENPEELDNYYTASEIARRIDIRLDNKTMNEAMVSLGYKTFVEKAGVPTNPDNSAFVMKMFEDDEKNEKNYYIQVLWKKEELANINKLIMENPHFDEHKAKLVIENKKTVKTKLEEFTGLYDYVVLSVKKTGFSLNKDFVVYISYSICKKETGIVSSGYILLDDDIDEAKTERYLDENEFTGMAPYDYIGISVPTMDDCQYRDLFLPRVEALRSLYPIVKGKNVIFYNKSDENFIKRLFENEGIAYEHTYENIINGESHSFKDLIDWLEPKESFKLKDVFTRYKIMKNKSLGFQQDATMLNEVIIKVLNSY
jgi:hypothetical protein